MNEILSDKWLRGKAMRSKWRSRSAITVEFAQNQPELVKRFIKDGYKYKNGFKAIGHMAGVDGDDFVRNQISVIFFLMKVPRICRR